MGDGEPELSSKLEPVEAAQLADPTIPLLLPTSLTVRVPVKVDLTSQEPVKQHSDWGQDNSVVCLL